MEYTVIFVLTFCAYFCLFNIEVCHGGIIWHPYDGRNRAEVYNCEGLDCKEYFEVQEKMDEIEKLAQIQTGTNNAGVVSYDDAETADYQADRETGCVKYTKEQADIMLYNMRLFLQQSSTRRTHRKKRKLDDFKSMPQHKWPNPIIYKFDGSHSEEERDKIRAAIGHIEKHTCLHFFEFPVFASLSTTYLLFTNINLGCWSYVGRINKSPQFLNLADSCLKELGTPVHEILHALGVWHEQQRPDRDDYITVLFDNIGYYRSQFFPIYDSVTLHVEYDYGSIMHYSNKAGSRNNGYTIEAKNKLFQRNMGQRSRLSYLDAKILNRGYCKDSCSYRLPRLCKRGGYQDPNNCSQCRCPDGFQGTYCEKLTSVHSPEGCGGTIIASYAKQYITSPGYDSFYKDSQKCTWLIKAPRRHRIHLQFHGRFGFYCTKDKTVCQHWVEVRYSEHLGLPGPRLCCYKTPTQVIKSKTEEMLILFRSDHNTKYFTVRVGFNASIIAVPLTEEDRIPDTSTKIITTTATIPIVGTHWGEWSDYCQNHQCKCGGYSEVTRYRMCGEKRCEGEKQIIQRKPCSRICTEKDKYIFYVAGFYVGKCNPCHPSFKEDYNKNVCVRVK